MSAAAKPGKAVSQQWLVMKSCEVWVCVGQLKNVCLGSMRLRNNSTTYIAAYRKIFKKLCKCNIMRLWNGKKTGQQCFMSIVFWKSLCFRVLERKLLSQAKSRFTSTHTITFPDVFKKATVTLDSIQAILFRMVACQTVLFCTKLVEFSAVAYYCIEGNFRSWKFLVTRDFVRFD